MKINFIVSTFLLTILIVGLAAAAENSFTFTSPQDDGPRAGGTEKPLFRQTDDAGNSCYVFKEYIVKTVASTDGVGEDIKFYKRSGAAADYKKMCASAGRQTFMTLPNQGDSFFYGLFGDKFLVDSGTSAGDRGLDIVSLTSKKVIYSTSYNEVVKVVGNAVIYNKPSNTKGSLKNCPNYKKWRKEGGGEGWARPMRLDLTTLKETPAGPLICHYVE